MIRFLKSADCGPWLAAALFLLGGVLWLFFEVVFQGRVLFFGDLSLYFLPQLAFERTELLAGRIPLWNPYLFFGQPFVGNPQTWPLYPSVLWLLVGEAERANALSTVGQVLWLALGMLVFLRRRGLGAVAATLGAVAFAFGGAVVSKAQFPNMLQAEAWLPWQLWCADRVVAKPSAGCAVALALVSGLGLLAAHPQISMMQFYLVVAWCLFQSRQWAVWRALLGAGVLGAGLSVGQLLSVVEHARASVRPELTLAHANRFYLPQAELKLLLFPNAFGNPATDRPWQGHGNFWEPCCYVGVVPVGLALVGLLLLRSLPREARFWLGVALVGFWLALGRAGGLFSVVFNIVPGVKQFHDPARFLYLGTFGLSCLAALVAQRFLAHRRGWLSLLVVIAVGDVLTFSRTLNPTVAPERLSAGRTLLAQRLAGQERVFHTAPYAPWGRWVSYHDARTVLLPGELEAFLGSATPNLPLWVRVRQAGGYEPVVRQDVAVVLDQVGTLPLSVPGLTASQQAFLASWGVSAVQGYDRESRVVTERAVPDALPRVSQGWLREVTPQRVTVQLGADQWGDLILRDTLAPGWHATTGGKPLPLEPEQEVFRRVTVPIGARRIDFRYDPSAWRIGVFLSLGTACILGALMISRVKVGMWQSSR